VGHRQARVNLGIRRRLAPLLGNHRPKIELMNGLLFSLPGTPVLYYGDEIGMSDNIYLGDRFSPAPRRVEGVRVEPGLGENQPALIEINAAEWDAIFYDGRQAWLEKVLPDFMRPRRWFGGKARKIKQTRLRDAVLLPVGQNRAYLTMVDVEYVEGANETYMLPMAFATGNRVDQLITDWRHLVLARLHLPSGGETGVIYDPLIDRDFCRALLDLITGRKRLSTINGGEITACPTRALRTPINGADNLEPQVVRAEQSNSSVIFGNRLILKLFRKVDSGLNPDLEIGRYLTEERSFPHTPPVAGALEYVRGKEEPLTLGILQGFVVNEGNAWDYMLEAVRRYYDEVLARPELEAPVTLTTIATLLDATGRPAPELADLLFTDHLERARVLGQRTAELHLALATGEKPNFQPEAFSTPYQRSLYQSMRSLTTQIFQSLRKQLKQLPESVRADVERVLAHEEALIARFQRITGSKIEAMRTRIHGDYHLGQVLFTGKDFMIIDFEGEPVRPISERRIKRSPLCDVAGMLRSFQYAAYAALFSCTSNMAVTEAEALRLRRWADFWYFWVCAAYLRGYFQQAVGAAFLPPNRVDLETLIEVYLLEKVVYEIGYEMNNRPTWLSIPLSGILRQVASEG
jgi:maltose alpha-D-glucosyltransferase/alpha-amylase